MVEKCRCNITIARKFSKNIRIIYGSRSNSLCVREIDNDDCIVETINLGNICKNQFVIICYGRALEKINETIALKIILLKCICPIYEPSSRLDSRNK